MSASIGEIIAGAVEGTFNTGINIWNTAMQQAKFDYDRALQQHIFQREDTAVQRRLADLQAAGLNPQLAAGSGAGAGAVVSTQAPQMKNLDIGAALDTATAFEKIKQAKIQTEILEKEKSTATWNNIQQEYATKLAQSEMLWLFSDPDNPRLMNNPYGYGEYLNNTNFFRQLNYQYQNQMNAADILQKQNNWFTANQIIGAMGSILGDVTGLAGGFNNFSKGLKLLQPKFTK